MVYVGRLPLHWFLWCCITRVMSEEPVCHQIYFRYLSERNQVSEPRDYSEQLSKRQQKIKLPGLTQICSSRNETREERICRLGEETILKMKDQITRHPQLDKYCKISQDQTEQLNSRLNTIDNYVCSLPSKTSKVDGKEEPVCHQVYFQYLSKRNQVCEPSDSEQLSKIQQKIKLPGLAQICPSRNETLEERICRLGEETDQDQTEQLNSRLNTIENYVRSLPSKTSKVDGKLESIKNDVDFLKSKHLSLNERLTDMEKYFIQQTSTVTSMNSTLESYEENVVLLEKQHSTLNENLNSVKRDVYVLQSESSELNESLMSIKNDVNIVQLEQSKMTTITTQQAERIEQLSSDLQETKRKLSDIKTVHSEDIKNMSNTISELMNEIQESKEERKNMAKNIAELQLSILNGERVFIVLVFVVIIGVAYKKSRPAQLSISSQEDVRELHDNVVQCQPAAQSVNGEKLGSTAPSKNSTFNLNCTRKAMDNSISVVSFSESGSKIQRKLIESVYSSAKLPSETKIHQTMISKAGDISKIPPSKVVFVFVNANKRHIILEDPKQEIGGFRTQTVESILEMGCDVFLIYFGDEMADDGSLFHHKLTSIQRHQVLKSLSAEHRVLSINASFSKYQREFLEKEIRKSFI